MDDHPSKRQLRPTSSQTTAEFYGDKYGISEDVQNELQNVGRKVRMVIGQGRTFDRTQSYPVFSTTPNDAATPTDFGGFNPAPPTGFSNDADTREHAKRVMALEEIRRNELKPYSQIASELPAIPAFSTGNSGHSSSLAPNASNRLPLTPSKKRRGDDEGYASDATEVDEEDQSAGNGVTPALTGSGSTATTDDFPAVFKSPGITQPELFARPGIGFPGGRLHVPGGGGRSMKGMPGRVLGKTVSAPVGGLGGWGGMEVDGAEGKDGFDVSEWAASEEF